MTFSPLRLLRRRPRLSPHIHLHSLRRAPTDADCERSINYTSRRVCAELKSDTQVDSVQSWTRACRRPDQMRALGLGSSAPAPPPSARVISTLWNRPFEFRHELIRVVRLDIAMGLLSLRQCRLIARQVVVQNLRQKVRDDVQPCAPLVVGAHDVPRRPGSDGRLEHVVAPANSRAIDCKT